MQRGFDTVSFAVSPLARRASLLSLVFATAPWSALAQPSANGAQDMSSIARTYYENGNRAFAEHRYGEACNAFRESHAITHRPELLFNIGRSCAEAGQLQQSLDALTLFESAGSAGVDRAALTQLITDVRARLAAQGPSSADAGVGDLPPPPPSPPPPPPPGPEMRVVYQRGTVAQVGPWVALGVGAATALVGIITSLDASRRVNQVRMAASGNIEWNTAVDNSFEGAGGAITRAWIFTTLGGALITTGALWLALRGPGERREIPVRVGLAPTSTGGIFSVGGAF